MKKLFVSSINENYVSLGLLVLRLFSGAFMLTHGFGKFQRLFSGEEIRFMDFMGLGPTISLSLAVFAEFLCAILIMLGAATRLATIPLIVTMTTAGFVAHAADPFGTKEKPFLFLVIFVSLLIMGGGKYSVDKLIGK
jgi:putative oxidoreductase